MTKEQAAELERLVALVAAAAEQTQPQRLAIEAALFVRALLAIPGAAAVSCVVSAHASRAEVGPEAAPPFETLANPGAARPGAALAPALR